VDLQPLFSENMPLYVFWSVEQQSTMPYLKKFSSKAFIGSGKGGIVNTGHFPSEI